MPILGVIDSAKSGNLYAASFESISTVTVGAGGASSVTFSSIPNTYTHLQVRIIARSSLATTQDNAFFRFNSDTGSNYAFHYVYATGSGSVASGASANVTGNLLDGEPGTSIASGIFAASILDILDYSSTSKLKTSKILNGWDSNGNGNIALHSGLWQNTAAINSITFYAGANFAQYSSFALYGIKGVS